MVLPVPLKGKWLNVRESGQKVSKDRWASETHTGTIQKATRHLITCGWGWRVASFMAPGRLVRFPQHASSFMLVCVTLPANGQDP